MNAVEQWPFTADGSVNLLRLGSLTGADLPRPGRPPAGLILRELVLRGVLVPGDTWTIGQVPPLPFPLRWQAAFLQAAQPGSLKSMIRATFKDEVRRRAMGLPPQKKSLLQLLKEEFRNPEAPEATPQPTAEDEAKTFTALGLTEEVSGRIITESKRTPLGDEWATRGIELLARLDRLPALVASDPDGAARLVQEAGPLVAVPRGLLDMIAPASATLARHRPELTVGEYSFDVVGAADRLLAIASPSILDHVSKIFHAATSANTGN